MLKLRPFFYYYGGKYRAAPLYPPPRYPFIIEPFAGAAGYSTRYFDREVRLHDADPVIAGLWDYLIRVSSEEILRLPININHVDRIKGPQEAKWLVGFYFNQAASTPHLSATKWQLGGLRPKSFWGKETRQRIAAQVQYIRHWKIFNKDYSEVPDVRATWFIDPPYDCKAGRHYRYKFDQYEQLAGWCCSRKGQVIVCEKEGADWLPFRFLGKVKVNSGSRGKVHCREVVWLNGGGCNPLERQART